MMQKDFEFPEEKEDPEFEVGLGINGGIQDFILNDEKRMCKIRWIGTNIQN